VVKHNVKIKDTNVNSFPPRLLTLTIEYKNNIESSAVILRIICHLDKKGDTISIFSPKYETACIITDFFLSPSSIKTINLINIICGINIRTMNFFYTFL